MYCCFWNYFLHVCYHCSCDHWISDHWGYNIGTYLCCCRTFFQLRDCHLEQWTCINNFNLGDQNIFHYRNFSVFVVYRLFTAASFKETSASAFPDESDPCNNCEHCAFATCCLCFCWAFCSDIVLVTYDQNCLGLCPNGSTKYCDTYGNCLGPCARILVVVTWNFDCYNRLLLPELDLTLVLQSQQWYSFRRFATRSKTELENDNAKEIYTLSLGNLCFWGDHFSLHSLKFYLWFEDFPQIFKTK